MFITDKYEEAIQEHEQEQHLCQANGDRIGEAVACRKIGECHCALGSYAEALTLQRRHLTLAKFVSFFSMLYNVQNIS